MSPRVLHKCSAKSLRDSFTLYETLCEGMINVTLAKEWCVGFKYSILHSAGKTTIQSVKTLEKASTQSTLQNV